MLLKLVEIVIYSILILGVVELDLLGKIIAFTGILLTILMFNYEKPKRG